MAVDLVRLETFRPGDRARLVMPGAWGGAVRKTGAALPGTVCEVELPCRLHASVLDMNRFGPGAPGGGGIGFGIALSCKAKVQLTEGDAISVKGNRPSVAAHMAALFREMTGYREGIEIFTADHGKHHIGLGSSIATVTAVCVALNEAFGRPLDLRDLRKLAARNYVEEAPGHGDRLVMGFETNIGAMVGIHGGMVVGSDDCELIYRIPFPPDMKALLVVPDLGEGKSSGEEEADALLGRARDFDRGDAERKAYLVLMNLLPAMIAGDFARVGDVVYQLALLGSKKAEIMLHGDGGKEIFETMAMLRRQGAEVVSMSSVGPAVFALSRKPSVWKKWDRLVGEGRTASFVIPVDNTGARVRLDGEPVPYSIEPWWNRPATAQASGNGRKR